MSITKLTKELISERMKELKIKQVHIAEALGASTSSVSNWVNGVYDPSSSELPLLLKILKLSLIDGEIVKNDYAGIVVPVIKVSDLDSTTVAETTETYATKEHDVEFIIRVNTHNFMYPFGARIYVKKFNGVEDYRSNMLVVIEDENKKLKIAKIAYINESYFLSMNSNLTPVDLKDVKYKISLVKF